jgi:hypothetical protein
LRSGSGLGFVLFLGLFFLHIAYSLKNEKDHLLMILFPKNLKKNKIIAFSYAFCLVVVAYVVFYKRKELFFKVPSFLFP